MTEINIGSTIARERRRANLTQSELAGHLGVSKAAVSKWELGQSLPDVALLPCLAAFFDLTLDELFDYRPQLEKEQIYDIYVDLLDRFSQDANKAYEYLEDLIARHYSCWSFLTQMGVLYLNRAVLDASRSQELLDRAEALFLRVEEWGDDAEAVRNARFVRGTVLQARGDTDGAIALLTDLKPSFPFGVELVLATLYQAKGDKDTCLQLYQELAYYGVMNIMAGISAQLQMCDESERLAALLGAGEGMLQGFVLVSEGKGQALAFLGAAATACLKAGDEDCAADYLLRFVEVLEEFDVVEEAMRERSMLYDHVSEDVAGVTRGAEAMGAQFEALGMRSQLKSLITSDAVWNPRGEDPRFKALLDRLAAM